MDPKKAEDELVKRIGELRDDPYGFVLFAFDWGHGELAKHEGPDVWQTKCLIEIRDALKSQKITGASEAIQLAVASGHGPGKSALVAWIVYWAMSMSDTKGVVTANTETQLKTKTWAEISKWYRLCINSHWFELTATALYARDEKHERTWRIDMVPWSEQKTEAFAGLHNQGKRLLVIYDEASAIPDLIWETTEGALTDEDTQIIWAVFGNPTRNTGRFKECWGRFRHRWIHYQVDSRTARLTNKKQIEKWIADYGEDSDFVRVRVKGMFPRAGSLQFIPSDLVDAAAAADRDVPVTIYDPLIMGVDVARFGGDRSVIRFRRGRDARTLPPIKFSGLDTMQLAARVAAEYLKLRCDAVFVDGGGAGGGVVDRLRYLKIPVIEVQFGGAADLSTDKEEGAVVYGNKRAEMWGTMRDWLKGGMIDNDPDLIADLPAVEYGYALKSGKDSIMLEKKEDMIKRGLASPDDGDALALTFAYPVAPSDHSQQLQGRPAHQVEYDPYAEAYKTPS